MLEELILVFFLIRYIRRNRPADSILKKWDKEFKLLEYGMIGLAVVDVILLSHSTLNWLGHIILLTVIAGLYSRSEFRFVRNIVFAVLPFGLASILKDLVKLGHSPFWGNMNAYFKIIYPCTVVWMIALFILSDRQRKAVEKEREKRLVEEEQNRAIAARKAELEKMVTERTAALLAQKEELEHALVELRETQTQLIQSEKMASLGELTAGIAHEIQNPLNFVNNFSEVNKELVEEMQLEIEKGDMDEVRAIARDIKENEIKINYHGKRADSIVKGMLQHSRASSGKKEPTNINALADEYLRLSYHGLRAKDKLFNATFKTDLDESIGLIDLIPQDFGRVLLNLCNNAFYSVNEKKKDKVGDAFEKYEPTVLMSTKKTDGIVEICVRDNGIGIPPKVLDKIYQPFFTTKPTGQGTGLGLSLSYEIIKAHGGELETDTKEGEFAEFVIKLPVSADHTV